MAIFTKYNAYKLVTPVARQVLPHSMVTSLTTQMVRKHQIRYLEIGGAVPVSGYLVIHLSPVELYGIPRMRNKAIYYHYDPATDDFKKEYRNIKDACTLNYNLMNGIPLADKTIDAINMSHFLEHFTREEGIRILKECLRVLKPGGFLRISCPDLRTYAEAYLSGNAAYFEKPLVKRYINYEGLTTLGDLFINKAYDGGNGHKWFYDAESAIQVALDAGFKSGAKKALHETSLPQVEIVEPAFREIESFYVEVYS